MICRLSAIVATILCASVLLAPTGGAAQPPAPTPTPPPVNVALDVKLLATLVGGAEEVPNPGDPDGTGTATVMLRTATNQVCWETQVANLTLPAMASHIHRGARGVAGPIVVPFTAPDATGRASGCAVAEASLLSEIGQNPAGFYVNVHTSDFPGGAVRGQLAPAPPDPAPEPAPGGPAPQPGGQMPPPVPVALPDTGTSRPARLAFLCLGLLLLTGMIIVRREIRQVK